MKTIIPKICPICLSTFNASLNQIYCKRKCKDTHWDKNHQEYRKNQYKNKIGNFSNGLERTKIYRRIQLNSNNIYEKKFIYILHRTLKIKFKPQFIISPYIVDIFIISKALIIEIDGSIHDNKINQIKDELREEYLRSFGLFIVRYTTHTKETPEDFINQTLNIFPDIKKRRLITIRKKINIINSIAKIKGFIIETNKSYLDILFSYRNWRKKEKIRIKFPNWVKHKEELAKEVLR